MREAWYTYIKVTQGTCKAADLPKDALPRAHACICTIDLPEYSSFAVMRRAVHTALSLGSVGFDEAGVAGDNDADDAAEGG